MATIALLGIGLLVFFVSFVCTIIMLVAAFKESAGQGLLCIFVPFYSIYYSIARFQHAKKGLVLGGMYGGALLGGALLGVSAMRTGQAVAEAVSTQPAGAATTRKAPTSMQDMVTANAKKELDEARSEMKTDLMKATMSCAAGQGLIEGSLRQDGSNAKLKQLQEEAKQLCKYEIPLAQAQAEAKKVEESAKKKPKPLILEGCMGLGMQLDNLKEAGFDQKPEVVVLAKLSKKQCE
jgi:hypothetical protein